MSCFRRLCSFRSRNSEDTRVASMTPLTKLLYEYRILSNIATGSSGDIYTARKLDSGVVMAIKVCPHWQVEEVRAYVILRDNIPEPVGIPKIYSYGYAEPDSNTFLAMQLLGSSLSDIIAITNGRFTIKTVCMLAIRLIKRLEYIHSKEMIHGDINPGNIVMGKQDREMVYLIDFENSKRYRDEKGDHLPLTSDHLNKGNFCYSSIHAHDGLEVSRRDDFISLSYTLIKLADGTLPWERNRFELFNREDVVRMKKNIGRETLCQFLPVHFRVFVKNVQKLGFSEQPDYKEYISLFQHCLEDLGAVDDAQFCWFSHPEFKNE